MLQLILKKCKFNACDNFHCVCVCASISITGLAYISIQFIVKIFCEWLASRTVSQTVQGRISCSSNAGFKGE